MVLSEGERLNVDRSGFWSNRRLDYGAGTMAPSPIDKSPPSIHSRHQASRLVVRGIKCQMGPDRRADDSECEPISSGFTKKWS